MAVLTLLPEPAARAALAGRSLVLRVLAPPFPALGVGKLRVLRIVEGEGERDGLSEIVAGYERYERLEKSQS
jgi:hypothetical protein